MYCCSNPANSSINRNNIYTLAAGAVWIIGLILGWYWSKYSSDAFAALARSATHSGYSVLGSFFILFVPFILSAFFILFSQPVFSLVVLFIKALLISFCGCGIVAAFSSAGWLVRPLLLFSDSCITVLLLWFFIRNLAGRSRTLYADLFLCAVLTLLVCCIDSFAVSPYLMLLL